MSSHEYAKVAIEIEESDSQQINEVLGNTTIEMSGLTSKEQLETSLEDGEQT